MNKVEKGLFFLGAAFAPLTTVRIGAANLGVFDVVIFGLLAVQIYRRRALPSVGLIYSSGAFVVIGGLASAIAASHPMLALGQVLQWGFIFFVVVPAIYQAGCDPGGARWMFFGVLTGLTFLAAHSLVEIYTGTGEFIAGRYAGLHGSPQLLAFAVSSFLPYIYIGLVIVDDERAIVKAIVKVALLVLTIGLVWLIFMTASRTGLIASLVAVGVVVGLMEWEAIHDGLRSALKRSLRLVFYVMVLFAGLMAIVVVFTPEAIDVVARRLTLSVELSPSVVQSRMRIYGEALRQLDAVTLLTGVGLENYPFQSEFTLRPHNLLLMAVWEGGIVFVVGLMAAIGIFFKRVIGGLNDWTSLAPVHRYVTTAAVAGFVAFLVIAMLNTQSIHRMYWFNYAYGVGALSSLKVTGK